MTLSTNPQEVPVSTPAAGLWELHRRSWELELLISGAVIFSLFQLPASLDQAIEWSSAHLAQSSMRMACVLALIYLESMVYVLAVNLMLHFALRAFWIGLIGLGSVFPQGIRFEELGYGALYLDYLRGSIPDLTTLTLRIDRFCSIIFSFTFAVILLLVSSSLLLLGAFSTFGLLAGSLLGWQISPGLPFLALMAPFLLIYGLDKLATRRRSRLLHARWFRALASAVYKVYGLFLWTPIVGPITFVLLSNVPRRRITTVLVLYILSTFPVMMLSLHVLRYKNDVWAPDDPRALGMRPESYENLWPSEGIVSEPSIPSDVIEGGFVRLFVPHRAKDNDKLAEHCPGVRPFAEEGLQLAEPTSETDPDADRRLAEGLQCLGSFYEVRLDGRLIPAPDWVYYEHPRSTLRGIAAYLPADPLAPGRHLLEVAKPHAKRPSQYFIPFWRGKP